MVKTQVSFSLLIIYSYLLELIYKNYYLYSPFYIFLDNVFTLKRTTSLYFLEKE